VCEFTSAQSNEIVALLGGFGVSPVATSDAGTDSFLQNVADTEQFDAIAPVVYVVPDSEPPHPLALAVYPAFGVTVRIAVEPLLTVWLAGEIEPPAPAVPVTM
jgi:hypothetical protein